MGCFAKLTKTSEKRGKNRHSATYYAADVSRVGTGQRKMPHSRSGSGAADGARNMLGRAIIYTYA